MVAGAAKHNGRQEEATTAIDTSPSHGNSSSNSSSAPGSDGGCGPPGPGTQQPPSNALVVNDRRNSATTPSDGTIKDRGAGPSSGVTLGRGSPRGLNSMNNTYATEDPSQNSSTSSIQFTPPGGGTYRLNPRPPSAFNGTAGAPIYQDMSTYYYGYGSPHQVPVSGKYASPMGSPFPVFSNPAAMGGGSSPSPMSLSFNSSNMQRSTTNEPVPLSVLTYNVLMEEAKHSWHPTCPPEFFRWSYRKKLTADLLTQIDADVVCLQECASQNGGCNLGAMLESLGYDTGSASRVNSMGYPSSKLATAIGVRQGMTKNGNIIEVKQWFVLPYATVISGYDSIGTLSNDHQSFMGVLIEVDRQPVFIVNVHLTNNSNNEGLKQLSQVGVLMHSLMNCFCPVISVGDYNITPHSSSYGLLTTGKLPSIVPGIPLPLFNSLSPLKSAYYEILGKEPDFTSMRGAPNPFSGTLDYIMYSSPVGHSGVPAPEVVPYEVLPIPGELHYVEPELGLPNERFSSDHVPLCANFNIFPPSVAQYFSVAERVCNALLNLGWVVPPCQHLGVEHATTALNGTDRWSDGSCASLPKAQGVYLRNLPSGIENKESLRWALQQYGRVVHVHLAYNAHTGEVFDPPQGFAFFEHVHEAQMCIESSKRGTFFVCGEPVEAGPAT